MQIHEALNPEFRIPRADFTIRRANTQTPDHQHIDTPDEVAKQFEKILVEQFVRVMTEDMFSSNLSGENGPEWMKSYGDQQRDILSQVLTDHLVEQNTFNISSLIMKQWQTKGMTPESVTDTSER